MQVMFSKQIDSSILFDPYLISQSLQKQLSSGFILRPLHVEDFDKGNRNIINHTQILFDVIGFSSTLGQLSVVDGLTKTKFEGIFLKNAQNNFYF